MNDFFNGRKLYGDDFSHSQILQWYEEESEGYANLGSKDLDNYMYEYHALNKVHGFNKLKGLRFDHALGFGSAWGYEFEPVIDRISRLTIVEPSDHLRNEKIGQIRPEYVKPSIEGNLPFESNCFDLITCFGTLHHIANVSFVLHELIRVLAPGGHLLIREPIISFGDWSKPRKGLTKNERGIPVGFFDKLFLRQPVEIVSKSYCFTMTAFIQRVISRFIKRAIYSSRSYIYFDRFVSNLLKGNVHYHATKKIQRIAPSSIFYVLRKKG